jgi:general secretion pathway protein M
MMENIKVWFAGLEQRERRLVIAAASLGVILLLYVAIWEPLSYSVTGLRASTADQRSTLVWMRQAAQEIRQLRGNSGAHTASTGGQSLLTLVDRTVKISQLGGALKRIQPDGDQRVQVWMEGASFDDVIRWLVKLKDQYGIQVESSTVEVKEQAGRVDARLVLGAAA